MEYNNLNWPNCFAVRGSNNIIDIVNPETGKTAIFGKTLEECKLEKGYENAELMTVEEFQKDKAERQNSPIVWSQTTKENYNNMLECLPPAVYVNGGFLVGEPWDHHAITGQPRFAAFKHVGKLYFTANRPLTVNEFKQELE